ncbi:Uncharacterised protein [Vibrio cholerae]|nr:Uncharacterised protein [Vibrio cholerae]
MMSLIPHTTQPTSPVSSESVSTCFGVKIPKRSTPQVWPVLITLILSFFFRLPFLIRTRETTPK